MSHHVFFTVTSTASRSVMPNYFTMNLNVESVGDSKEEARQKLEKLVKEKFNPVFSKFESLLEKVSKSYNFYDSYDKKGNDWVGNFDVSFGCDDISKAKEIYDSLSSINKVNVGQPRFTITKVGFLEKELLVEAKKIAEAQAEMECEVMGVPRRGLEIISWNNSFRHREKSRSKSAVALRSLEVAAANCGDDEDSLVFEPTEIDVDLNLTVSFGTK